MHWLVAFSLLSIAGTARAESMHMIRSRRLLTSTSNSTPALPPPMGMPPLSPHLPSTLSAMALYSCAYSSLDGTCMATNYLLLGKGAISDWSKVPFAGRAQGFLVAGSAYCGRLASDSPNCTYPCASNGERCALASALVRGIYACVGSEAIQDTWCTLAPASNPENPKRCSTSPFCKQLASPGGGTPQCIAKFKAALNSSSLGQYYTDFATTRRDVWGCCEGSQAMWMGKVYCDRFSNLPDQCASQQGCQFGSDGTCSWSPEALSTYQFGPGNVSSILANLSKVCSAITDSAECDHHGPISADGRTILQLLGFKLSSINKPIPSDKCVVWESGAIE